MRAGSRYRLATYRAMALLGALAAALAPIRQGYVFPFAGIASAIAVVALVPRPRVIRLVLGAALVLASVGAVADYLTDGWHAIFVALVLAVAGSGLLGLWRLTRPVLADDDPRIEKRRRRARRFRVVGFVLGAAALVATAVLTTTNLHPTDSLFGFNRVNCGSLISRRHFTPATGFTDKPSSVPTVVFGAFADSDCDDARSSRASAVVEFGALGIVLLGSALGARGPSAFRRAGRLGVSALVAVSAVGATLAISSGHAVSLADQLNRQAVSWKAKYEKDLDQVTVLAGRIAEAASKRDYPDLANQCSQELSVTQRLDGAPRDLPGPLTYLQKDLRSFVDAVAHASTLCVQGANARDQAFLEHEVGPAFVRAETFAAKIEHGLAPR
ncbi:MAG TPA: hypothetical protein VFA83_18515 [Acidimicrobiales bacterium]|nr:hypothetical protein [Acidimicrobiales bacterium]